jgi:hypothetical protein
LGSRDYPASGSRVKENNVAGDDFDTILTIDTAVYGIVIHLLQYRQTVEFADCGGAGTGLR